MRFVLIFSLLLSFLFGDDLAIKLQKLISNKSEKKVEILKYDPFFTKKDIGRVYDKKTSSLKRKKIARKIDMKLVAILDNQAFIDDRWVAKNDIIYGYRVKKILKDSIVLIKKRKKVILRFKKGRKILKIREK